MRSRALLTGLLYGIAIVALSGCLYRMDIAQGNRISPELIGQIEIGMSRKQVEFLLGTPAIIDPFHPDQWHYIYYFRRGEDGAVEQRRMTLYFSNDQLADLEGSLIPI